MIYSVSCQVSSVKLMRLFEYNATMYHHVPLCPIKSYKKDRGGKKLSWSKSLNHLGMPEAKRSDGADIADLSDY